MQDYTHTAEPSWTTGLSGQTPTPTSSRGPDRSSPSSAVPASERSSGSAIPHGRIEFLGHVIGAHGIATDPPSSRASAAQSYPVRRPTSDPSSDGLATARSLCHGTRKSPSSSLTSPPTLPPTAGRMASRLPSSGSGTSGPIRPTSFPSRRPPRRSHDRRLRPGLGGGPRAEEEALAFPQGSLTPPSVAGP